MLCKPEGPSNARIMLVGEAPGAEEDRIGLPFQGTSGYELNRMLKDAGLHRSECFLTNVARIRPPGNDISAFFSDKKCTRPLEPIVDGLHLLEQEINAVQPNVIVPLGNTPLWALANRTGITKWRGSILRGRHQRKLVPTYHPAAILRQYEWRFPAVQDLRRARRESLFPEIKDPSYDFLLRPTYSQALDFLRSLTDSLDRDRVRIALDLETRAGHIACLGLATDTRTAICIPFMCVERPEGYWTLDEEVGILGVVQHLLGHPNLMLVGQNLVYDFQYIVKHWGVRPRVGMDTMLAHHVCWPALPKALHFQASIYASHYVYWKDEGKNWDSTLPEDQLWEYNCLDAVYTWECSIELEKTLTLMGLMEPCGFQHRVFDLVLDTMLRGVRVDLAARAHLDTELSETITKLEEWLSYVCNPAPNPASPKQMAAFFYEDLRIPPVLNRSTGRPTCDDEALTTIGKRYPILRPIVSTIADIRSLRIALTNVVRAPVDNDKRIRTSYNVGGTVTFRLSSSESAFGSGTNLQNISEGGTGASGTPLPNLRKLYIADPGYTLYEIDLAGADLQVVAWDSGDEVLKAWFREGLDVHLLNARDLFGLPFSEGDLRSPQHAADLKRRYHTERQFTKVTTHGTDYGGKARTMAAHGGTSVAEMERFQRKWFARHPWIEAWQRRIEHEINTRRYIFNQWGYRNFIFGRPEELLGEALAWVPQSTIAITINRIWERLAQNLPALQVLLQVHDSLVFQLPDNCHERLIHDSVVPLSRVQIPYSDPLIIPIEVKGPARSWGEAKAH